MSQLYVDNIKNRTGGAVGFPTGAVVTGVLTATSGSFTGNVSIAGTLTYEDVNNIDSVGVITAREGIKIPDNKKIDFGAAPDLSIYHQTSPQLDIIESNEVLIRGKQGLQNPMARFDQGGKAILYNSGTQRLEVNGQGAIVAGILTATSFRGDGSQLEGVSAGVGTTASSPSANSVVTLNLTDFGHHDITLTAGITTITCTGGAMGASHSLIITQPSSGIATVGFSTYFLFPSGSTPSLSEGSSKVDLLSFVVRTKGQSGIATQLLASAGLNYQ